MEFIKSIRALSGLFSDKKEETQENRQDLNIIQDPFTKDTVERIYISMRKSSFLSQGAVCRGSIEFEKGKTKGEQTFEGSNLVDVMQQMEAFLKTL